MIPAAESEQRLRVAEFQRKHRIGLVTLLFTDMVGSTKLKQDLGDREAVMLIQHHHTIVREALAGFKDGQEISTSGDSFFIVFAKPSDAVRFSLLLQSKLRDLARRFNQPVSDRIGVHVGEVFVEECEETRQSVDLYGIQVDAAARVMSLAQGGQVLMTRFAFDNARQVLRGQDIQGVGALSWMNHGMYRMKGVEEPLEICEVGEAGLAPLAPPANSEKATRHLSADSEPVLGWRPAVDQFVPNTKWLLKEKLGEGGFGEVWLGSHEVLGKQRVFKFCFRADRVRSLKREVTFFRVLMDRIGEHPNIVGVEDIYFDEPPYYIVMSYAEGKDLAAWAKRQGGLEKIPMSDRLEVVAQVADALQAAHSAGVIHRDVKPTNVLITADKSAQGKVQVKLTDFGIGQAVSEEVLKGIELMGMTETMVAPNASSQSGTYMYMPPEFIGGKTATPKSDVYSLGVVLYQIVVGDLTRPLGADWAEEVSCPVLRGDLKRCFARNPDDRFSAGDLAVVLRSYEQRKAVYDSEQTAFFSKNPPPPKLVDPKAMRFDAFTFSNGAQARNVAALKELCRPNVAEAAARLRDGKLENWLLHCEEEFEAERAKQIRETAGDDGEAALDEFLTGTRPFIFRTGEKVTTLEEWFAYAKTNSSEARHQLYTENFEHWLRYRGWKDWAEIAARLRAEQSDREVGVKEFFQRWEDHQTALKLDGIFRAETKFLKSEMKSYRRQLLAGVLFVALLGAAAGWAVQWHFHWTFVLMHPSPSQWASPLAGCAGGAVALIVTCLAWLAHRRQWRARWKGKGIFPLKITCAKAPDAAKEFRRARRIQGWLAFQPAFLLVVLLPALGFGANYYYGRLWKEQLVVGRLILETRVPRNIPHRTNSLGMVFAKVPETGAWFSIWETRQSDYAAFAQANPQTHGSWQMDETFPTDAPSYPVAYVTWNDAEAFCDWLTRKESVEGKLPAGAKYRLPTDLEWSAAVGLPREAEATPKERSGKILREYPWGKDWPPPLGAGNLYDIYAYKGDQDGIPGYYDGQGYLAPVGAFAGNKFGLYDLEGNLSEWCEDWSDAGHSGRVVRGGNLWEAEPDKILSSYRDSGSPTNSEVTIGFRIVLTDPAEKLSVANP